MDREAWGATVHRVTQSRTQLKRLSTNIVPFRVPFPSQGCVLRLMGLKVDLSFSQKSSTVTGPHSPHPSTPALCLDPGSDVPPLSPGPLLQQAGCFDAVETAYLLFCSLQEIWEWLVHLGSQPQADRHGKGLSFSVFAEWRVREPESWTLPL